ncbi:hypothetical protein IGI04_036374 [Brassica rapa subsp. trilocularis]|uniref:Uncharacterized protein n=1 Tax=Brassica rapa subsp. trilocularis TaxID=1813537 RepID=A0ABQ7LEB5_BRACM|nr:hypothetical protein IGI04_036374 [Brassica rapa subsp. trilocularis]
MKTLTGLDGLFWIRTEPPLASGQFFRLPGGSFRVKIVENRRSDGTGLRIDYTLSRHFASLSFSLATSGCVEMSRGRGVFIGDTSQSASGWWQPVCRFAWLRTHVRRHLVLHMAGCMSQNTVRTHKGHFIRTSHIAQWDVIATHK